MKGYLLFITVMMFGCTYKPPYPKYHQGQEVFVKSGFYKNSYGVISSWHTCSDRDSLREVVCYELSIVNNGFLSTLKNINEKDILIK